VGLRRGRKSSRGVNRGLDGGGTHCA
jgi:hypothetical protein